MRVGSRIGAAALAAVLVIAGGCSDDDGGENADGDATTSTSITDGQSDETVPRDGDPEYCAGLVDFQERVNAVSSPPAGSTAQQVVDHWNALAEAEGRMVEHAPDEVANATQQVITAFDQFRLEADALAYEYESLADLPSANSIDPGSSIAAAAASLFVYGDERCPLINTG